MNDKEKTLQVNDFELVGSRSAAQSQLGNSVPPLLAEKVVRALHGEA